METTFICEDCGQVGIDYDWVQASLDESHELFYTATECGCGYLLTEVDVYRLVPTIDNGDVI